MKINTEEAIKKARFCLEYGGMAAEAIFFKIQEMFLTIAGKGAAVDELLATLPTVDNPKNRRQDVLFGIWEENGKWKSTVKMPEHLMKYLVKTAKSRVSEINKEVIIGNCKYRLNYDKREDGSIAGSYSEVPASSDAGDREQKERKAKTENIMMISRYMIEDREFYDWLMEEFYLKWAPLDDCHTGSGT